MKESPAQRLDAAASGVKEALAFVDAAGVAVSRSAPRDSNLLLYIHDQTIVYANQCKYVSSRRVGLFPGKDPKMHGRILE